MSSVGFFLYFMSSERHPPQTSYDLQVRFNDLLNQRLFNSL